MPVSSFIRHLRDRLAAEKSPLDLSRNAEYARFGYLACRDTSLALEFVAAVDADGLSEREIVRLRDAFFETVRRVPSEFGLRCGMRNPNGLLCFVFSHGCSEQMARFVGKQTAISHADNAGASAMELAGMNQGAGAHSASGGAVVVSWAVDVPGARIHTHANPVSLLPPVYIAASTVFPGLEYLEALLAGFADAPYASPPKDAGLESPPVAPSWPRRREEEPPVADGVKILFLGANSLASPLDLERELREIEDNLLRARVREGLAMKPVWAATPRLMMEAMLNEAPTHVHFSGHGSPDGIVLRDEVGNAAVVAGQALASVFELFRDSVRCVVLNSCYSEAQARAIREHVPHVVGIRAGIKDKAAMAFSTGFYMAIAARKEVEFAFRMGKAQIAVAGLPGEENLVLL